jgi:hypothetical protein
VRRGRSKFDRSRHEKKMRGPLTAQNGDCALINRAAARAREIGAHSPDESYPQIEFWAAE